MNYRCFIKKGIMILIPSNMEFIKISEGLYKVIDRKLSIESEQGSSNTPVLMTNQTEKPQIYWEI
jgi:hypothetical protein